MDIGGLMTKQEIKKAIEKGKSVWVVYNTFLPYTLVMEENLTKEYSVEPYYQKEQEWALWLKNRYICDIDRVYKTKAEAEHYLHHANITRTEQFPFLTWEEFKEEKDLFFTNRSGYPMCLCVVDTKLGKKIGLGGANGYFDLQKMWDLTEENFYKAYDECVRLFKQE